MSLRHASHGSSWPLSLVSWLLLILALPALAERGPDLPDYPAEQVAPVSM
jgi:hypothetical protein